jgi:hypothetical protein
LTQKVKVGDDDYGTFPGIKRELIRGYTSSYSADGDGKI